MSSTQALTDVQPDPDIREIPITPGQRCYVIDHVLRIRRPGSIVPVSIATISGMTGHNAYPGVELRMPDLISERLGEYFAQHVRSRLGARRTERVHSRPCSGHAPARAVAAAAVDLPP